VNLSGQRLLQDHRRDYLWLGFKSLTKNNNNNKKSNNPYILTLFGRVSRKILFAHPKTNSTKFSFQTQFELLTAQGSVVRWKKLFGNKHSRWVWCTQG